MQLRNIAIDDKYTREDGTFIWRDEWPGMDGSDDPYEGFLTFPLLYTVQVDDLLDAALFVRL